MKLIGILVGYLAGAGALFGALMGGSLWLVRAGEATTEKRVPPIPPRIAESIERKLAPVRPEPVAVTRATETMPAMQQAPVSLPQSTRLIELELKPAKPERTHAGKIRSKASAPASGSTTIATASPAPAPAVTRAVSTGRSDSPY
jgi:hypothetical protein